MEDKMHAEDLVLALKRIGFDADMIETYLSCWKSEKTGEQLRLLSARRACLLDQIHQEEKQIDCLDYLVYRIRKGHLTV
ncbi:MAG: hypothetical protein U0L91_10065 [Gemmiger sp.]|uniref:hypothetical protein n=1 Tax=Gemmiger sp. TaxID=2049027 RepID=UPI002E78468A|nr:hypothetical protein [Gemmiger sp.]MEE0801606.1 hypothetical protein [Gemmiger sp.]